MFFVELLTVESLAETPFDHHISDSLTSVTGILPSGIASPERLQSHHFLFLGPDPLLINSLPCHSALLRSRTRYALRSQQRALDPLQKDLVVQACSRGATKWHRKICESRVLRDPLKGLAGTH